MALSGKKLVFTGYARRTPRRHTHTHTPLAHRACYAYRPSFCFFWPRATPSRPWRAAGSPVASAALHAPSPPRRSAPPPPRACTIAHAIRPAGATGRGGERGDPTAAAGRRLAVRTAAVRPAPARAFVSPRFHRTDSLAHARSLAPRPLVRRRRGWSIGSLLRALRPVSLALSQRLAPRTAHFSRFRHTTHTRGRRRNDGCRCGARLASPRPLPAGADVCGGGRTLSMPRREATELAEAAGAQVTAAVSGNTDILVAGPGWLGARPRSPRSPRGALRGQSG
jgi:hypothetical protein